MDTKQRIFLAARRRFDRSGAESISMRNLAKDVGLTPMALYRHYADKEAILHTLTMDALAEWGKRVAAIEAATPLEWLDKEAEAFLDFALQTPRRFEAAFFLPSRNKRRWPDVVEQGVSAPLNAAIGVIRQGQQDGIFCGDSPLDIFMACWGLTQGLISLYRAEHFAEGEAAFREIYLKAARRCIRSFVIQGDAT